MPRPQVPTLVNMESAGSAVGDHQGTVPTQNLVRLKGADVAITSGPESGAVFSIDAGGITVGTRLDCDVQLTDSHVSRRHLQLSSEVGGVRVRDLGSRNGTFLGRVRVTDVLITQSAVLTLGGTTLAVTLHENPTQLELSESTTFGQATAHSRPMRYVFRQLEQASPTSITVLLEGESGTGKDILATSIHMESPRKNRPLIVVDCGAIPEHLIESELFGHEKGAFTGAQASRMGAFEMADGGTLFLDEVGELPLEMQPKLLRVLETRSFRRVGGSRSIEVDVRIVAATNRGLKEAVRRREFREDLFYRLAVVHITLPRLVDRPEDIPPLAELFFRKLVSEPTAVLPPELLSLLTSYHWPGNARELRNVIERFATFGGNDPRALISNASRELQSTPTILDLAALDGQSYHQAKRTVLESFHAIFLKRALARANGSITKAAELLGLPRPSMSRMLGLVGRGGDSPTDMRESE